LKNNLVFIVLFLFLAVTIFFWFQVLTIRDLPPVNEKSPPVITPEEAENFVALAQELLIDYREPLPELYGRDPFIKEGIVEQVEVAKIEPSDNLTLSSIIHSDLNALAVINGKILAEGDTIYDEETGTRFMIENIEVDKIEIIDGEKTYTLEVKPEGRQGR
jgi:hypothetical protein